METLNDLENRIEKPAYLLLLVIVLILLIVGFVNLIDHTNNNPVIFGRYSPLYFTVLVFYTVSMVAWASLLRKPNDDRWLTKSLDYIQQRPLLALSVFVIFGIVIWTMFYQPRAWYWWPAIHVLVLIGMLLAGSLLVLYRWGDPERPQWWRKLIVYPLLFLVLVEVILQALSFARVLPNITTLSSSFVPYSRVYQTNEGYANGIINKFGRYYPTFRMLPDSRRVLLVGDSYVQALQVAPEENLGVLLEGLIAKESAGEQVVEVLGLGDPDYGPGLYLGEWMLETAVLAFAPDEVIAFFDPGSDFQTVKSPAEGEPYFIVDEQGKVVIHPDAFNVFHRYEHDIFRSYEGIQLVLLFNSHYLTPQVIKALLSEPVVAASGASPEPAGAINLPNSFVFNEATDDEAQVIATGMIRQAQQQLAAEGASLRLVTIPVFTEAFVEQNEWNTRFGEADLLLPERELRAFAAANGIPFLGLGTYMEAAGLVPEDLKTLFFNDGLGHFTPEGHAFAAEAVYQCFYDQTLTAASGCDVP